MKHWNVTSYAMWALLVCFLALTAAAESISMPDYRRQLQDIEQKVDALKLHPDQAGNLIVQIPDNLTVKTNSGEVSVNCKNLKDDLTAFVGADAEKRKAILTRIQKYVRELNAAAESYDQAGADATAAQGKLHDILSRREFNKVKGPSATDALLTRIFRWLSRLLRKLTIRGGAKFDWMQLLIYLLVGAAATLLIIWTVRRLRRPHEDLPEREIIPFAPSARSWRTWLAEARELAQQQDWRNAIHLAYWAGISYLEEHGAWKPNRARTPREYLRLIGNRAAQYPVLAELTRKLELVWYGYGSAAASDFDETLGQLEKLGCR